MKGFVKNIEEIAFKNEDFRQVLYTANNCRLVMMPLKPKEAIGKEGHKLGQILPMEEGTGEAFLDGVSTKISAGFAVLVPVKTIHNINTGSASMKLYSFYAHRIVETALSTISAPTQRKIRNTSMEKRRSRQLILRQR